MKMREISFRGKRVDNGEWVYGCFAEFVNYLDGDTKPGIQVTNQVPSGFDRMIPAFETELVEVIPETVGQYTGLKDKNGEEIYEGDITQDVDTGKTFEIMYQGHMFMRYERKPMYMFYTLDGDCLEVIGNIYEQED